MTPNDFLDLLRSHLAALRSPAWPKPHGFETGPAIYLDAAETEALIAALARLRGAPGWSEAEESPPAAPGPSGSDMRA